VRKRKWETDKPSSWYSVSMLPLYASKISVSVAYLLGERGREIEREKRKKGQMKQKECERKKDS
jgi:hypothetical protein